MAHVADLDGKMANLSTRLEKVDAKVEHTKTFCADLGMKVGRWISIAAVALTILLAWFGISQIGMTGRGWRLMQEK